jgi:DNA mismatch repair ATPase MutL
MDETLPVDRLRIENLSIIGQSADKSVILCYHAKWRRIVCFDQHAVDERIRYEKILDRSSRIDNLDQIKSMACHGAIRVGDKLTLSKCHSMIKRLLNCKVPFRCAHSRNNVAILKNLDEILILDMQQKGFPIL